MKQPVGSDDGEDVVALESASSVAPEVAEALLGGVPRRLVGGGYVVLDRAEPLTDDLICFAANETSGYFCIEVSTGHVVEITDEGSMNPALVNKSLGHFRNSVRVFNSSYPFYSSDDESERWGRVADEIGARLALVDEMTGAFRGFWEDVLSSVSIGDYATEMIIEGLPD